MNRLLDGGQDPSREGANFGVVRLLKSIESQCCVNLCSKKINNVD